MTRINLELPETLGTYLATEATRRGYATTSEFVQSLIQAEQHRRTRDDVERLLLESVDGPFSEWTDKDVSDIRIEGQRLLHGRRSA